MNIVHQFFKQPYLYIVIVLIGISLKLYKLDEQFFWDDEICTILHTSGISMAEYEKNIPVNEILPKKYFDDLLRLNDRDLKISDQFLGLAKMPQLTPGHYYYLIVATRIFGDNYMVYRYFSVFIFLLSVPLLFLLTKKIFKSDLTAWVAICFYTVSPFFQVYVQEARYYPLWSFTIILLHYLFLIAIEKEKSKWWILYAIYGIIAVQTTIFIYITLLGHFIYSCIYYRPKLKSIIISQFAIFLMSVPWLIYAYLSRGDIQQNLAWLQRSNWNNFSLFDFLLVHFNHTIESFTYFNYLQINKGLQIAGTTIFGLLIATGIYEFFRRATNKQKWFVGLMAFLGVFAIIMLDIMLSTWSLYMPRYSLLSFVGFFVLFSFVVQKAIEKRPIIFGLIFLFMISLGIISSKSVANDTVKTRWKRTDTFHYSKDATEKFSGQEHILIITDFNAYPYTAFISLLHASKNDNIDIIYVKPEYPNFKTDFDLDAYEKVYFAYISNNMLNYLKKIFTENEFSKAEKENRGRGLDIYLLNSHVAQIDK